MTEEQHRDDNRDVKIAWKDNSDNEQMEGGDKEKKPADPVPAQPASPNHLDERKHHVPA